MKEDLQEAINTATKSGAAAWGSEKVDKFVSLKLTEDEVRRLNKAAAHLRISRSQLIRVAVRRLLKEENLWIIPGPTRLPDSQAAPRTRERRPPRQLNEET